METNRLHIRRFHAQYLVANDHAAPVLVKARIDEAITQHRLAQALSSAFSPWFSETDPSVWLVRRLDMNIAVNASWEPEQLTRAITTQIGRTLGATLQDGADHSNVVRFPNRPAYLARFLSDLAEGVAWSRWYYESFAGLRMLPTSAALRTAICDKPDTGREALLQLAGNELEQVLGSLTTQDARRILDSLAASAATGDEFRCFQAVWAACLMIQADLLSRADESRQALYLYLASSRDREDVKGASLKSAALALLRLAWLLANNSVEQRRQMLAALTGGEMAALYQTAGAANAETLLPLLSCPPAWVHEVAQAMVARQTGQSTHGAAATDGRRDTAFGGVFLLLPLLDQLPLLEATHGWPHAGEANANTLARFLVLIKCCGQQRAHRAFYDPLLRDLMLIPPTISPAILSDWRSRITPEHLRSFLEALLNWQSVAGTIAGEKQILASSCLRDRSVVMLIDGARGLWMLARRYSPRRPRRLSEGLRYFLSRLEREDGVLLCEPSLLPILRSAFPGLKIVSLEDEAAATTSDGEDQSIMAGLDQLSDELSYLALPDSLGLAQALDLTLSVAAQHVMRAFAWRLPGFARSGLAYLYRNFLDFGGSVEEEATRHVVRLGRPPLNIVLSLSGVVRRPYHLGWMNDDRPFMLFQEV